MSLCSTGFCACGRAVLTVKIHTDSETPGWPPLPEASVRDDRAVRFGPSSRTFPRVPLLRWELQSQEPGWPVSMMDILLQGCHPGVRGEHSTVVGGTCGMTYTRAVVNNYIL